MGSAGSQISISARRFHFLEAFRRAARLDRGAQQLERFFRVVGIGIEIRPLRKQAVRVIAVDVPGVDLYHRVGDPPLLGNAAFAQDGVFLPVFYIDQIFTFPARMSS